MFYEKLKMLCDRRNTNMSTVLKDLKLSKSSSSNWKSGQEPLASTAVLLAQYFDVTVEYLFLEGDEADIWQPLDKDQAGLLGLFNALDRDSQMKLIGQVQVLALLSQGELTDTLRMIRQLRDRGLSASEILKMADEKAKENHTAEPT